MDAEVIVREGRPFTILLDKEFTEDDALSPEDAIVTGHTLSGQEHTDV